MYVINNDLLEWVKSYFDGSRKGMGTDHQNSKRYHYLTCTINGDEFYSVLHWIKQYRGIEDKENTNGFYHHTIYKTPIGNIRYIENWDMGIPHSLTLEE